MAAAGLSTLTLAPLAVVEPLVLRFTVTALAVAVTEGCDQRSASVSIGVTFTALSSPLPALTITQHTEGQAAAGISSGWLDVRDQLVLDGAAIAVDPADTTQQRFVWSLMDDDDGDGSVRTVLVSTLHKPPCLSVVWTSS